MHTCSSSTLVTVAEGWQVQIHLEVGKKEKQKDEER